ncbi:hypothetical protein ACFYTQ_03775 [Nocardia sp. NPDC004068]|uniref:hypothetical protein n=1 Tax=Nocardia sp. NPDC004068 TaxID=3364303 RepID=UPI0036BEB880
MLKSYKDLRRWYPPLEPVGDAERPAPAAQPVTPAFADDGAARYPHYIRETEPEPFDPAFVDEPPTRRAEFVGGWSDWVGNHAPGPDDDYPVGEGEVVPFPWDDDPDPEDELPRRARLGRAESAGTPTSLHPHRTRNRLLVLLAIAVVLLIAATGFAVYLLTRDSGAAGRAPLTMQLSVATTDAAADACPTEQLPGVLRGAEPGGTDSGPAAIMWFQHAYYVERSGERAREVVAPDAVVPPPAVIQRGIDSVPPGTDYCVRVVTRHDGEYAVEVTERRPGGVPSTYNRQTVTTAVVGGRTLITSITAG